MTPRPRFSVVAQSPVGRPAGCGMPVDPQVVEPPRFRGKPQQPILSAAGHNPAGEAGLDRHPPLPTADSPCGNRSRADSPADRRQPDQVVTEWFLSPETARLRSVTKPSASLLRRWNPTQRVAASVRRRRQIGQSGLRLQHENSPASRHRRPPVIEGGDRRRRQEQPLWHDRRKSFRCGE